MTIMDIDDVDQIRTMTWDEAAYHVVTRLINAGSSFTADDVWAELTHLGMKTDSPTRMNGPITKAKNLGYIEKHGYVNSLRKKAHGRPIPVWRPLASGVTLAPGTNKVAKRKPIQTPSEKMHTLLKQRWITLDELATEAGVTANAANHYVHWVQNRTRKIEQKREAGQYFYRLAS